MGPAILWTFGIGTLAVLLAASIVEGADGGGGGFRTELRSGDALCVLIATLGLSLYFEYIQLGDRKLPLFGLILGVFGTVIVSRLIRRSGFSQGLALGRIGSVAKAFGQLIADLVPERRRA